MQMGWVGVLNRQRDHPLPKATSAWFSSISPQLSLFFSGPFWAPGRRVGSFFGLFSSPRSQAQTHV